MGAAGHFFVGRQRERAFVCARDAFFCELFGDGRQSFQTAFSYSGEQVLQRFIVFVEIQPDDVDGAAAPRYRDFRAVDQAQAEFGGFGAGFGQAAGVVMVGEGEQGAAVGVRQPHHFGGAETAV